MENQSVKIDELVDNVKSFLALMEDGDISASPYDTAWVALIDDIHQTGVPQFPSTLSWIVGNQSMDGSWGYDRMFMVSDRLINTLACIIALKKWNIYPCKYEKGLKFVRDNISRVGDGNVEHMLSAFEVVFPPLLDMARKLLIELPDCSTPLRDICAKRSLKLSRISKERMYNVPTTLLYSLEGLDEDLDWEKLLKLQHEDGSFMTSPSATAFAFMKTKDNNCLIYLNKVTQRFNGGVPTLYPIDLFEQLWGVDRLQRLGISRFFKDEIDEIIGYLQRCWTKNGISWTRYSRLHDTDCIGMGFRLLRMKGYQVSSDVFKGSKKGINGEFACYEGQWNEGISVMSSLYRASQLLFPQEKILHEAKMFSSKFLRQKQIDDKVIDKWVIPKDLPGEVAFLLDVPWYACLPRLEASFFIEQYGGDDVVWIAGKTLYRVPYIDNNMYLELAKADYNNCQALHRDELKQIHDWYHKCEFGDFGLAENDLVLAYFVAFATIFEPERSIERFAWAKTAVLLKTITSYFDMDDNKYAKQRISSLIIHFQKFVAARDYNKPKSEFEMKTTKEKLIHVLLTSLNQFSRDAMTAYGEDITQHLCRSWEKWLLKWQDTEDEIHGDAEVLVNTINLMAGRTSSSKGWFYDRISNLTNRICSHLVNHQKTNNYISEVDKIQKGSYRITTPQIEREMEELVEMVLNNSSDNMDFYMKQTFLAVTKTFYYTAFFDPQTVKSHIARILSQKVS